MIPKRKHSLVDSDAQFCESTPNYSFNQMHKYKVYECGFYIYNYITNINSVYSCYYSISRLKYTFKLSKKSEK